MTVGGTKVPGRQRAGRARRGPRLRPRGPAPRGLRAAAVDRRERHPHRSPTGSAGSARELGRRAGRIARQAIADLAIKTSRPRPARSRPVRRQRAEGRHGPRARQSIPRARADRSRRPASTCGRRSRCSASSTPRHATEPGSCSSPTSSTTCVSRDRVLVMLHGRITQELTRGWTDRELVAATEGFDPASVSDKSPLHPERTPASDRCHRRQGWTGHPPGQPEPLPGPGPGSRDRGPADHRHVRRPGLPDPRQPDRRASSSRPSSRCWCSARR